MLPEIGDLVAVFSFHVYALLVEVELNLAQVLRRMIRLSWKTLAVNS